MTTLLADPLDFAASSSIEFDPTDLPALIALEAASDAIRTYTGQSFDAVYGDVVSLHGTGNESLLLPQLSVNAVTAAGWIDHLDVLNVIDPTTYRLDQGAGILWRIKNFIWPWGKLNIHVTYDHGYTMPGDVGTAPPLPADIQVVCMQLAGRLMFTSAASGQSVSAETIGSYSVTYASRIATTSTGLTGIEEAALSAYRLARVA